MTYAFTTHRVLAAALIAAALAPSAALADAAASSRPMKPAASCDGPSDVKTCKRPPESGTGHGVALERS